MTQLTEKRDLSPVAALQRRADDCRLAVGQLDLWQEAPLALELLLMALEADAKVEARIRSVQQSA